MFTLSDALKAVDLCLTEAKKRNVNVSVAVVDSAGTLIAAAKMDKAISISPKFAYTKAYTAAAIGLPSGGLAGFDVPGQPYYGLHTIMGGALTTIAGGEPIVKDGTVVGGVGVGGSTDVNEDDACAKAALAAFA